MARQVWSTIVAEVSSAKYFSIIVDSTPDITHLGQLVFAVRCVNKTGVPVERFLKFIVMEGYDAEYLTNNVINSGVASPENLGGKKIWGCKMFDFRRMTLFCLEKRLSKHKMTIFSKNLEGVMVPFVPPWLRLWSSTSLKT